MSTIECEFVNVFDIISCPQLSFWYIVDTHEANVGFWKEKEPKSSRIPFPATRRKLSEVTLTNETWYANLRFRCKSRDLIYKKCSHQVAVTLGLHVPGKCLHHWSTLCCVRVHSFASRMCTGDNFPCIGDDLFTTVKIDVSIQMSKQYTYT